MAQLKLAVLAVVFCFLYISGDAHHMEEPCAQQGGICTLQKDCGDGHLTFAKGLCPETQSLGYECCNGIEVNDHQCRHRGGECVAKASCGRAPVDTFADDCAGGEVCCIWI